MSSFLCVGDLHLDKGGRYGRVPGARLAEQERVWVRALELGREHDVDAILFAGDAFEKRHPSTDAMLAFERPLVAHRDLDGPRVIAIPGNHDRSGVSDFCALDVFHDVGLIDLFSRHGVEKYTADGPTLVFLPWAPVSRIVAAQHGGDRDDINAVAAEFLLKTARGLREQIDGPAILLTHFSISGAVTPDGADVGIFREPVLQLADLEAIGFDAVVAGHIHKPQLLNEIPVGPTTAGPVFYVGSPMPLDFGEAKCEHGVYLLDVGDGHPISVDFLPIESRSFVTLDVDLIPHPGPDSGFVVSLSGVGWDEAIPGAFVKARVRAGDEQARRLNVPAIRADFFDRGAHNVWIEITIERELRARVAGMDETVTDVDAMELWMESQSLNGDRAPALRELHGDYLQEIS